MAVGLSRFELARWWRTLSPVLPGTISNYLALMFIAAVFVPWIGFAWLALDERSEQIQNAEYDLRLISGAYAEYVAAAIRSGSSDHEAPAWLGDLAKQKAIRLDLRPDPGVGFDGPGGRADGVVVSARVSVPGSSLTAVASTDEEAGLAAWQRRTWMAGTALIFRTALAAVLGLIFVSLLRWREAAEQELIRTRHAAEAAARAKSDFLAKMSHELRTPLNAILGFSEAIKAGVAGPLADRYRTYAGYVHASGAHLLALIDDVLDLSRLEAGRFELRESSVDLVAVLRMALHATEAKLREQGLHFTADIPANTPLVFGDGQRLQQVFTHLLSNAVRFTPCGGRVSLAVEHQDDQGLTVRIEDTGIGMTAEQIPVALEPFRQIRSGAQRHSEGAGLGLPLSKHLVELHGGRLSIESRVDAGTTVTIRFPAARVVREAVCRDGGHQGEPWEIERSRPATAIACAVK